VRNSTQEQHPASRDEQAGISRRELIRFFSLACAGLLSNSAFAGKLASAREPGGPIRKGQILSESQMHLLRELAEVIIPETDTPGAAATDSHGFIDDQLANCRASSEASEFIAQIDLLGGRVRHHWGKAFPGLSPAEKSDAMSAIASNETPFEILDPDFFYTLKALTVVAYYSSQAGASQELVYLPIPGGYRGDFKVSENGGKAFSPAVF
jgi:hypothetical protein